MNRRECGECQACCTVLAVKVMSKPEYMPCSEQCSSGCAIQSTKPAPCVAFECEWLRGDLNEEHRPDKFGLIFSWQDTKFGKAMIARECRDGAAKEYEPFLKKIGENVLIIVSNETDRGLFTPKAQMRKVLKIIEKTKEGMKQFVPKE